MLHPDNSKFESLHGKIWRHLQVPSLVAAPKSLLPLNPTGCITPHCQMYGICRAVARITVGGVLICLEVDPTVVFVANTTYTNGNYACSASIVNVSHLLRCINYGHWPKKGGSSEPTELPLATGLICV